MSHEVICGDSAEVLKGFEDESFECVVTDPPHGLEFMGTEWDRELPAQAVWDETFRVLKPGGHVWVMASDRPDCFCGFYLALKKAGFAIDNSQFVVWLNLQGMPKSVDVAKTADKEAFRAWLAHVGAELTAEERRKAESAAVNGACFVSPPDRNGDMGAGPGSWAKGGGSTAKDEGTAILSSLLSSHWPSSPSARLAHWQAVVGEVPEGWDTSRPPGVRVKTGDSPYNARRPNPPESIIAQSGYPASITQPSTPLAAEWSGWRGSVAPFRPLASLILHAQKPHAEGTYLDCAREHGTGSVDIDEGRIPFGEGPTPEIHVTAEGQPFAAGYEKERGESQQVGRVPGNLLTYAQLLGSLTHQADLDAWAERLGLPTASAELLEAGVCYAPKPGKKEKEAGLEGFDGELPVRSPMNSSLRKCGNCGGWISHGAGLIHRPNSSCRCENPEPTEYVELLPRKNQHPTCKPVSLCAFLVALSTREGDRVLDPFFGSGTTGVAAKMLGREGVGVELDESFCEIARARIAAAERIAEPQPELALTGGN